MVLDPRQVAERVRHLRWLTWFRVGAAVAALAMPGTPLPIAAAHVAVSLGFLALFHRSAWYRRTGWFDLGGYDFAYLFLAQWRVIDAGARAQGAVSAVVVCGVMVALSGLLVERRALLGAVALGLATSIGLLLHADHVAAIPFAVIAVGAGAAIAMALRRRSQRRAGV